MGQGDERRGIVGFLPTVRACVRVLVCVSMGNCL